MITSARKRLRNDTASSVVLVGVALALGVGAIHYYKALSQLGQTASSNSSLVSGQRLRVRTELTEKYVGDWFRYFLMPRRPRPDARWIICYGCDTSDLGGVYVVRWHDDNGISIGQLR